MNLIDLVKQINRVFPNPPVRTEEEQRVKEKDLVVGYATGNVSLQRGRYITRKDVERRKSALASYNFVSKDFS